MQVKELKEIIKNYSDDAELFAPIYEIDEANEHIENNLCDGYKETDNLTKEEWSRVVSKLQADDGIWQTISEAFNYYVEQVVDARVKNAN
jgi:hypothetical protein